MGQGTRKKEIKRRQKRLKERKRAQRRVDVPTAQLATAPKKKRPARKTAAAEG